MGRRVARRALGKTPRGQNRHLRISSSGGYVMALVARNIAMLAKKGKLCSRVVEQRRRLPRGGHMTGSALCPHRAPVNILMARDAGGVQSQRCPPRLLGHIRILDELRGMAIFTLLCDMFARQSKSCLRMIKM